MDSPTAHGINWPPLALCHGHADLQKHLPDFLILSPPKTGSTWLAANLPCHPGVFVPPMKEVKYFSMYHRWLGLDWYAEQFRAAAGRLKGDVSPSYGLLPCRMIRWLHSLMPHVKLVFLLRDPVERAWSHARHNFRYREANFAGYQGSLEDVPEERWRENFRHPWPVASGDYLGQLRRWRAVFPREQIYVELYERLASDPQALLQRILNFLGVEGEPADWSAFRMHERILPGADKALPADFGRDLRQLWYPRTRELQGFLRAEFGLNVADAWESTLGTGAAEDFDTSADSAIANEVFAREFDDEYFTDLLEGEIPSSDPQLLVERYHHHNLVLHRGRFLALAQSLGHVNIEELHAAVARGQDAPGILVSDSLTDLKERVARQVIAHLEEQHLAAAQMIRQLQEHVEELSARQRAFESWLTRIDAFIQQLRNSPVFRLGRALRQRTSWMRVALRKGSRAEEASATLAAALPQKPP